MFIDIPNTSVIQYAWSGNEPANWVKLLIWITPFEAETNIPGFPSSGELSGGSCVELKYSFKSVSLISIEAL